eukprot:366130-Chlamydomonas_euryale.AAC.26
MLEPTSSDHRYGLNARGGHITPPSLGYTWATSEALVCWRPRLQIKCVLGLCLHSEICRSSPAPRAQRAAQGPNAHRRMGMGVAADPVICALAAVLIFACALLLNFIACWARSSKACCMGVHVPPMPLRFACGDVRMSLRVLMHAARPVHTRASLTHEISELRKEAAKHNTPATYAKCAKCQRSIAAKERELAALGTPPSQSSLSWQDTSLRLVVKCKCSATARMEPSEMVPLKRWFGLLVCGAVFYGQPLVYVDVDELSPMTRMLSMPHGQSFSRFGAIAVIPWMILSNKATSMLSEAIVPVIVRALSSKRRTISIQADEMKKDL